MPATCVIGLQWGDEAKCKIVDLLSEASDVVVRYQGGPNAGHTVVVDGRTTVLHLIPSGILHPHAACVLGNGVVINLALFFKELEGLAERGVDATDRLWVSDRAHLILPGHRALEAAEEKGPGAVGTTLRGIGPAYRDKMARIGVTVGDFLDRDRFLDVVARQRTWRERMVPALPVSALDPDAVEAEMGPLRERLQPMVRDTAHYLYRAVREGKRVLLEGAQGTLLDVDHGTYPFVTSSNATAGGACTGSGISPRFIDHVLGVTKAYSTRVGLGPFPTDMLGPDGDARRGQGGEFGATTGRPRRCGWLDGIALRHAVRVNGMDSLVVTKLDVLSGLDTLKIAVAYDVDGTLLTEFPSSVDALERAKPVYEELPGWSEDLSGVTGRADLPDTVVAYLNRVREIVDTPVSLASVGQGRAQTVRMDG